MGLQVLRVALPAVPSSPGVFCLWPGPERIPTRVRPGILFPSKAPMEEESPLLERGVGSRGKGRTSFLLG